MHTLTKVYGGISKKGLGVSSHAPVTGAPKRMTRIIRDIVQGAWRRRLLIILPVILMVPMGIAAAIVLPKAYMARSLLQLQEASRENPFSREGDASNVYRIQERFEGLRALFTSERVLARALGGAADSLPTPERAAKIDDLRNALSFDLIGGDFIEVKLAGAKPEGLGKSLEAVMASFLEALVPEQGGTTAAQLMVSARRQELGELIKEKDKVQKELAAAASGQTAQPPGPDQQAGDKTQELQTRLANLDKAIAAAQLAYESYVNRFSGSTAVQSVGILKAPELIRIIDPPHDPVGTSRSRLLYFLSAVMAGGLLGLGFAFMIEKLDQRVRHADEASEATGLPVLAVI